MKAPHIRLPVSFLIAVLSASAISARANIMFMGPVNHVHSVAVTGCPATDTATVTLNPDPVVHVPAPVAGGLLDMTFTADIAQFPGWTLAFGAALGGTLNITDYLAVDRGACRGGARMDATYAPAATDPAGLTFLNLFMSNAAGAGGGTHIDPFPNDDTEPLYYTAAERARFGLRFVDNPFDTDNCAPCTITTQFNTYLVTFDAATMTVTARDGWMWGYTLVSRQVPEPSTVALIVSAIVALVGMARRKRVPRAASGNRDRPQRLTCDLRCWAE